jgi:hypothetical protein
VGRSHLDHEMRRQHPASHRVSGYDVSLIRV